MKERPLASDHTTFATWPRSTDEELAAADRVLRSGKLNYWTGLEGRSFEREFADYAGCKYAVAVANGTVALELALHSLGIGPGDEVIVPSRTFIGTASSVVRCGATPVFADVDRESQNITAEAIRDQLSNRSKAVIAVHLAGWPCDMEPIMELARAHGLAVIEDCAQAHGARYRGQSVGSIGDAGAFSFCQDKIMTTAGEGGMLVTDRQDVWQRAWSFKDHGKSYDAVYHRQHPPGFRWLHEQIGTNWRLTEVQSAVGRVCLRRLDSWVATRRKHAAILEQCCRESPGLRVTSPPPEIFHSYYRYYAFVLRERLRPDWSRDRIAEAISAAGVPCFTGSCSEVYLEKAFDDALRPVERLPVARKLGETSLAFLVHPTLSNHDVEATCDTVREVMTVATSATRLQKSA